MKRPEEFGGKTDAEWRERVREYPHIVFANLGDGDNLVPIMHFQTLQEADAYIETMKKERPGYYCVDCPSFMYEE